MCKLMVSHQTETREIESVVEAASSNQDTIRFVAILAAPLGGKLLFINPVSL
jgi:hypothetical protein